MSDADPKQMPVVDVNMMKALGHPIRQHVLQALALEAEASAGEIAKAIGRPVEDIMYHVNYLEKHGAIEVARQEIVRNTVVKIYRSTVRPVAEESVWPHIPEGVREQLLDQVFRQIMRNVQTYSSKDALKDLRTVAAWSPLHLDDDAFQEVSRWTADLMERVIALEKEVEQRLSDLDPEEREARTHLVELDLMLYPLSERPGP